MSGGEAAHNEAEDAFASCVPMLYVILPLENALSTCFVSNTNECRKKTRISLFVLCRGGRERRCLPPLPQLPPIANSTRLGRPLPKQEVRSNHNQDFSTLPEVMLWFSLSPRNKGFPKIWRQRA